MSEPPVPKHLADYTLAQAVVAGDAEARKSFTREYGEKVLQTVYIWCKPFCNKDCHLRRAGIRKLMNVVLKQECDQVLESYAYLLDQLENVVLKRYRGDAKLSGFLFSILHPTGAFFNSYRIEFVRSKNGRVVLPVWTERLTKEDCAVFKELMQGNDVEDIGFRSKLPAEEVRAAVDRIREKAIQAGWGKYWRWLADSNAHETQMPLSRSDDDDENPMPFDPPADPSSSPDVGAVLRGEAARLPEALERLSPLERVILRLRFVEEKSTSEVAGALGKTSSQVRSAERIAIERVRKFMSGDDAPQNALSGKKASV